MGKVFILGTMQYMQNELDYGIAEKLREYETQRFLKINKFANINFYSEDVFYAISEDVSRAYRLFRRYYPDEEFKFFVANLGFAIGLIAEYAIDKNMPNVTTKFVGNMMAYCFGVNLKDLNEEGVRLAIAISEEGYNEFLRIIYAFNNKEDPFDY